MQGFRLFVPLLLVTLAASVSASTPATDAPRAKLASARWLAEAQRGIEREEYRFAELEPGAYSAPNRAQNLRARIDGGGLAVVPRSGAAHWTLGLRTRALAIDGAWLAAEAVAPVLAGERVELRRARSTEWFTNDARGIEHGWTIHAGPPDARELAIELELEGFRAEVARDGRSASFVAASGARLEYAGLRAFDAAGRELGARLEAAPGGLRVRVALEGARFPVLVDPVLRAPAWTAGGDQSGANLGCSVAGAGDVNGDGFDDLLVGANLFDAGQSDEGRAFVYLGSASGPSTSPSWSAESNQTASQFGNSVAGAGDVNGDGYDDVLIGSHEYDNGEAGEGRAYVFHGSPTGLSLVPDWIVEGNSLIVALGYDVAGAGDVNGDGFDDVIVSAPFWHDPIGDEGAAFVFHGSASGLSTTHAWTVQGDQTTAVFGRSVAGAGDVNGDGFDDVLVGAYWYDAGQPDEGRAYCFLGSASGLSTTPHWTVDGNDGHAHCGQTVEGAGDVNGDGFDDVLVGMPNFGPGSAGAGRAQLFYGSASGLDALADWTIAGTQIGASFAASMAILGDVNGDGFDELAVGAYALDGALQDAGRVDLYLGSASGPAATPDWSAEGGQATGLFGYAVAGAGDVDGDGYDELLIGAVLHDAPLPNEGAAFLYLGQPFCDCNDNGVDDETDIASGTSQDCNGNAVPDECDVAAGTSEDTDQNGVPDECQCSFQTHCRPAPNSVDPTGALIGFTGSASVPANDLVLTAGPCPPNQSAVFYFGPNAIQLPFGNGWRCVGGSPIHRLPIVNTGSGDATYALDFGTTPASHVVPGSRWSFQCWYRDPAAGGANFNLSNALAIDFCY